jgi:hypothetical protein
MPKHIVCVLEVDEHEPAFCHGVVHPLGHEALKVRIDRAVIR